MHLFDIERVLYSMRVHLKACSYNTTGYWIPRNTNYTITNTLKVQGKAHGAGIQTVKSAGPL